jgi:hypothetical protein
VVADGHGALGQAVHARTLHHAQSVHHMLQARAYMAGCGRVAIERGHHGKSATACSQRVLGCYGDNKILDGHKSAQINHIINHEAHHQRSNCMVKVVPAAASIKRLEIDGELSRSGRATEEQINADG